MLKTGFNPPQGHSMFVCTSDHPTHWHNHFSMGVLQWTDKTLFKNPGHKNRWLYHVTIFTLPSNYCFISLVHSTALVINLHNILMFIIYVTCLWHSLDRPPSSPPMSPIVKKTRCKWWCYILRLQISRCRVKTRQ